MNPNTELQEVMTHMPVTLTAAASLADIGGIFESNQFHHIPIVDNGALVGIISRHDYYQICHALSIDWSGRLTTTEKYQDFLVADVMTESPMHLAPDDTVGLAADIFLANKFHSLPIVDDGVLVGIVTAHDLIAYAFKSPIEDLVESE